MKLTWSHFAIADREGIFNYIAADNPAAAVNLDELFEKKSRLLIEHAKIGRVGRVPGTREFVVHPHYVFVYDQQGDAIRILRVLHTALQWPPAKPMHLTEPTKRTRRRAKRR